MKRYLSARSRLTLVYTSLFALGGAALVLVTYLLVGHTLHRTSTTGIPPVSQQAIARCVKAAQEAAGVSATGPLIKCAALYANGVHAGASAQRSATLTHLLAYSLLGLAGVTMLAAIAGWIVAGRILRPVHRLTAAARAASEQNLSQRIALEGPRDDLRELADTFDTMLERLDRAFTSQRQFIANASHELRTPLTVMRTAMDVVLAKPEPTHDELLSMTSEVRGAVDHAERLIEVLLILARNDQARVLTDPLDLAAVAEDALEGRTANGITTVSTLDEAPVTGDGMLLERLVANLLDNAERYNVAGGTISDLDRHRERRRPWCESSTPARPYQLTRSTACSCRSRASMTGPATRVSASAWPWSRLSQPSTAEPCTRRPSPPADSTSPFASPAATPRNRTIMHRLMLNVRWRPFRSCGGCLAGDGLRVPPDERIRPCRQR